MTRALMLVYGGTFDPPHKAHIELPRLACLAVGAEQVRYVPAGISPHKLQAPSFTPGRHRAGMLEAALTDAPWACVDRYEVRNGDQAHYTVDTLRHIAEAYPDREMRLLIGADQMLVFPHWHQYEVIERLAPPLVMLRGEEAEHLLARLPEPLDADTWRPRLLDLPQMPWRATELRRQLRAGASPRSLDGLPAAVADYMITHQLYTARNS